VPANELVLAPKRLATLGFGREVRRSEAVKAAERSARDFGFSSSSAAGAGGGEGCEGAAVEPWALRRMSAMSTFPMGS
jgi:hypothetical protein